MEPVADSADLLWAVRRGEEAAPHEARLRGYDPGTLAAELADDDARLAFWLNVYNAAAQQCLRRHPDRYDSRRRFFGTPCVAVAGREVSLDDVEHGVLRRGKPKWGLGYVPPLFPGAFARRFRVDEVDPRIHFALNCGAASCPPIAVYTADGIDDELDLATASYLSTEAAHDPDRGVVRLPRLLLWYRGDFGGKAGILSLLREHDLLGADARPRLTHRSYDWTMAPGNWAERRERGEAEAGAEGDEPGHR